MDPSHNIWNKVDFCVFLEPSKISERCLNDITCENIFVKKNFYLYDAGCNPDLGQLSCTMYRLQGSFHFYILGLGNGMSPVSEIESHF